MQLTVTADAEAVRATIDLRSFAVEAVLFTETGSILVVSAFARLILVSEQVDQSGDRLRPEGGLGTENTRACTG